MIRRFFQRYSKGWRPAIIVMLMSAFMSAAAQGAERRPDELFRHGWSALDRGDYVSALEAFSAISAPSFDLGDYVLYGRGLCRLKTDGCRAALPIVKEIKAAYPDSAAAFRLVHDVAYAAAASDDLALVKELRFEAGQGSGGEEREAQAGFIRASLLEAAAPSLQAAEAHLDVFVKHPATEAGMRSSERLWLWRSEGRFTDWRPPLAFYGDFARALTKAGDNQRARSIYAEAVGKFAPSDRYWALVLDFVEALRRQGAVVKAKTFLEHMMPSMTAYHRTEAEFIIARIEWRAGRLKNARARFLDIAAKAGQGGAAEKARYQAALMAEKDGDTAAALAEFKALSSAHDPDIRREALFRHAFGLYSARNYAVAADAFAAGATADLPPIEKSRHAYWRARCLHESGDIHGAAAEAEILSARPEAGPYALLALGLKGGDPFGLLTADNTGGPLYGLPDRKVLWDGVMKAGWDKADAARILRVQRLMDLGRVEFGINEASGLKAGTLTKSLGMADAGILPLFRFLAGDVRGAVAAAVKLPPSAKGADMADMLRYPLLPDLVGGAAGETGLDPLLIHSVMRQESLFQYDCLSSAGAVGLMQLMPATAAEVAGNLRLERYRRADLLDPSLNVRLGSVYLARLVRSAGNNFLRAVAAYNAGERAVEEWWREAAKDPALFMEKIAYAETRQYVRQVFTNLLQYTRIYRPELFSRYFSPAAPSREKI